MAETKSSNTGVIAGIIVVLLFLGGAIALVVYMKKEDKPSDQQEQPAGDSGAGSDGGGNSGGGGNGGGYAQPTNPVVAAVAPVQTAFKTVQVGYTQVPKIGSMQKAGTFKQASSGGGGAMIMHKFETLEDIMRK